MSNEPRCGVPLLCGLNTIAWRHWIDTTVQIRPELRFERAWDRKASDDGATAKSAYDGYGSNFSYLSRAFMIGRRKMDL